MIADIENPWKKFAKEIGGKYKISEEGTSLVTGNYQNIPFILKIIFFEAAPKIILFLSHFEISANNPDGLKFKIYREGIIQKLTKIFGIKDILFDEKAFDKKFIVEGNNEEKVKNIITHDIREKFIEIGEVFMILDGDKLIYEQSGKIVEIKKIYMILDMLVELAQNI